MSFNRSRLAPWGFAAGLYILQWMIAASGIGKAIYLSDQLDQTEAFLSLIQGNMQFLYGPLMSGTNPPVYCFGPTGSILFGLPTWLGTNPDQLHGIFIGLIALALPILFLEVYRHDRLLAYFWPSLIFAMPFFWWHHSLLWVIVFLLPVTCLELALVLRLLREPSWTTWITLTAVSALGLHLHSSAVVGAGLVAFGLGLVLQGKAPRPRTPTLILACSLLAFAVLPYIFAELSNSWLNARNILLNLKSVTNRPSHQEGLEAALNSISRLWTYLGLPFELHAGTWLGTSIFAGTLIAGLWAAVYSVRSFLRPGYRFRLLPMLAILSALVFATQALFFYKMNRPLLSSHYTSMLMPYCALPWAALLVILSRPYAFMQKFGWSLAALFLAMATVFFPKVSETNPWNFTSIKSTLKEICANEGPIATIEGPPFRAYDDSLDTLLQFIGKRYVPACTFQAQSPTALLPTYRSQIPPDTLQSGPYTMKLVRVVPPGIGIYRKIALPL